MPKIDFANGTIVSPEFLDSIFRTSGGHVHDGVDDDGHSSQINLATHVTGTLPFASVGSHVHTGAVAGLVSLQDHVSGVLGVERVWNTKQLVNLSFAGFSAGGTCTLIALKSTQVDSGGIGVGYEIVLLHFFGMLGTSNGTGFEAATGSLPAAFRPPIYSVSHNVLVQSDGLSYPGVVIIQTDGAILIRRHPSYPNNIGHAESLFAATGNKGFHMFGTTYFITY